MLQAGAQGVGVKVMLNGNVISFSNAATHIINLFGTLVGTNVDSDITVPMQAYYIRTGAVSPGAAHATMQILVQYL